MLNRIQVLVVGRHEEIMERVLELINKTPDWEAVGALADEAAIELFQQRRFDLVLMGAGLEPESEAKLRAIFRFQSPLIRIVQHYGAETNQLFAHIKAALVAQEKEKQSFLDTTITHKSPIELP